MYRYVYHVFRLYRDECTFTGFGQPLAYGQNQKYPFRVSI